MQLLTNFLFICRAGFGPGVNILQTNVVALTIAIGIGLVRFQLATDLEERLGIGGVRVFVLQLYLGVLCFRLGATGVGWSGILQFLNLLFSLIIPILNNYSLSRCHYKVVQNVLGCIIDICINIPPSVYSGLVRVTYSGYHDIFLSRLSIIMPLVTHGLRLWNLS